MKKETTHAEERTSTKRRILLAIGLPAWVLFAFLLAGLLVGLIIALFVQVNLLGPSAENDPILNTVVAALVYVLTLVIVIGVPLQWRGVRTTKEELGLTRLPSWSDILLAPAGFIVYVLFAGLLMVLVTQFFPGFDAEEVQDVGFKDITQYYEYVLAFITLVVLAPFAEEVLMRGYLYGKLKKVVPIIVAMLVSSLLFSLMHFQWNVAINVLPLAIMMVVLREMTGSIWAGILLHMVKNGVAFYLLFINPSLLNTIGG